MGPDVDCSNCGTEKVRPGVAQCSACEIAERYERKVAQLERELAEWRSGKRRVVGWRVYDDMGNPDPLNPHLTRAEAFNHKYAGGTVKRVTVGPAKKKEAGDG